MTEKTEKNLAYAFAAESKAAARNATFAKKAEMEGYSQIARLFRAVSEAESVHARRYLMLMRGKIGSTQENLETAFQNEIRANVEEYPKLIKAAAAESHKAALKAFSHSRDVELGIRSFTFGEVSGIQFNEKKCSGNIAAGAAEREKQS